MLLCHTGLALSSPVAGFGVSLSSVSFLLRVSFVRYLHLRFVCLFVYFVVRLNLNKSQSVSQSVSLLHSHIDIKSNT